MFEVRKREKNIPSPLRGEGIRSLVEEILVEVLVWLGTKNGAPRSVTLPSREVGRQVISPGLDPRSFSRETMGEESYIESGGKIATINGRPVRL